MIQQSVGLSVGLLGGELVGVAKTSHLRPHVSLRFSMFFHVQHRKTESSLGTRLKTSHTIIMHYEWLKNKQTHFNSKKENE